MPLVDSDDFLGLGKAVLDSGHALRFQARGWSMHPFIQDGDFLTVAPMGDSSIKAGDVVLYVADEKKVLVHRAVRKHPDGGKSIFLIKGDACLGSPERVAQDKVLGKVAVIERNGRTLHIDRTAYRISGLVFALISPARWFIYSRGSRVKQLGSRLLDLYGDRFLRWMEHLRTALRNGSRG